MRQTPASTHASGGGARETFEVAGESDDEAIDIDDDYEAGIIELGGGLCWRGRLVDVRL